MENVSNNFGNAPDRDPGSTLLESEMYRVISRISYPIWYVFFGKKRTFEFLFLVVRVGSKPPVDSRGAYAPLTGKKDRCRKIYFFSSGGGAKVDSRPPKMGFAPESMCYALQAIHAT